MPGRRTRHVKKLEITAEQVLAKLAFDLALCSCYSFLSFPQHRMRVRGLDPSARPGKGDRRQKDFDFDFLDRYGVKFFCLQNPKSARKMLNVALFDCSMIPPILAF
jgi:hypothetical protein